MLRRLLCSLAAAAGLAAVEPWTACPVGSTDAPYGFLEHLPPGYVPGTAASKLKHPFIFFLHGLGELGDSAKDLPRVAIYGPLKLVADKDPLGKLIDAQGTIIVAPQGLKADGWWKTDKLIATFETALKRHPDIDPDRIYVTGLSMGGGGTWALCTNLSDRLAAAVPICGAAGPGPVDRLGDLPIWASHSIDDPRVKFADNTRGWFEAILAARNAAPNGGLMAGHEQVGKPITGWLAPNGWQWAEGMAPAATAKDPKLLLTVLPGGNHDAWSRTYQNKAVWEWLFRQTRAKPAAAKKKP